MVALFENFPSCYFFPSPLTEMSRYLPSASFVYSLPLSCTYYLSVFAKQIHFGVHKYIPLISTDPYQFKSNNLRHTGSYEYTWHRLLNFALHLIAHVGMDGRRPQEQTRIYSSREIIRKQR